MLLTIREFKQRVHSGMDDLVHVLQNQTGRYGTEEEKAWRSSLSKIGVLFSSDTLNPIHLYFGSRGDLSLEYQLPAASSWCDIVLLGKHDHKPSAVILELKDWITRADQPGTAEGLIAHQGVMKLHPSDQVRGYAEYCRRFHSAVADHAATVNGCVVFTKDYYCSSYREVPNAQLVQSYPCFTLSPEDVADAIPQYFAERLTEPDQEFAEAFERGTYRQDRGFVCQIGEQILDPDHSPFELLDNQRLAFAMSREHVNTALFGGGKTQEKPSS